MPTSPLPHARDRVPDWVSAAQRADRLVLLLDFDGTLAPIVRHASEAALPGRTSEILHALRAHPLVEMAVVSGRQIDDVRARAGIPGLIYAGNHGMEVEGPEIARRHEEAQAARPALEGVIEELAPMLAEVPGAWLEDKGITLSVHYREVQEAEGIERVRRGVEAAAGRPSGLRVTRGKKVLEVRPDVDWHKGRAVEFLLEQLRPPAGAPVLYLGDDTTDEDAFRALADREDEGGEGVIVAEPVPDGTAARSYVRDTQEVAEVLEALLRGLAE